MPHPILPPPSLSTLPARKAAIDLAFLSAQTEGDTVLQRDLVRLLAGQIDRLSRRLAVAEPQEARQIAHALKGAAAVVGARALTQAAARCEERPESEPARRALAAEMAAAAAFIEGIAL